MHGGQHNDVQTDRSAMGGRGGRGGHTACAVCLVTATIKTCHLRLLLAVPDKTEVVAAAADKGAMDREEDVYGSSTDEESDTEGVHWGSLEGLGVCM